MKTVIPQPVKSINAWAFHGCKDMNTLTGPESITIIGDYTFCDCDNMNSLIIPQSVKK